MWQILQLIPRFKHKEILFLQKWFLLSSETTQVWQNSSRHSNAMAHTLQKAELPFHAKHLKSSHWSHESLKFPLGTAQPTLWQERFRQNFGVLDNAFTILRRTVQTATPTNPGAEITCSGSHMASTSISREELFPIQALVRVWKHTEAILASAWHLNLLHTHVPGSLTIHQLFTSLKG